MKLLIFTIFTLFIIGTTRAQTCPDQACHHTAKFWQTYSCFSDPAVNWPFGGGSSDSGTWASLMGYAGANSCDLRFTQFASGTPIETCLTNFQGADFLLLDLEGSTNQTALLLQEYYRFVVSILYTLQTGNGPCPVGPDGLPPGVPPSKKRLTLVELIVLNGLTQFTTLFFFPVVDQAGPNCDFSLADPVLVSQLLTLWTDINNNRQQCFEILDDECDGGCTQSQGYWKNHNTNKNSSPWPKASGALEDTETNILCGVTWLDWLTKRRKELPQFGNAQRILARQWIASSLNVLSGACAPLDIANEISDSEFLLNANCGNIITSSNFPTGLDMIDSGSLLEEYNEGLVGPDSC
uniref:Uncharacterized protein n=1 Tax=Pithovirus LCPAC202 TaxID=2506592 RepID=A0A481Z9G6_9VIRU|nr:MAG: hypothetical protein LCPAC202_03050 [Pithovirus LCPAC202]